VQNRFFTTAAAVALAASACVKSHVPPEDRVIPSGRYAYRATLLPPGTADSVVYQGTLVLDAVTPDSVVGRWEVAGYDPARALIPGPAKDFAHRATEEQRNRDNASSPFLCCSG
jgi:hypothetical protein